MAPTTFEQKLAHLKREAEHYADYLSEEEVEDEVTTKAHEEEDFCNDYSMAVVVGGLPVVDESKHGKLLNVVKKIFGQVGPVVDIHMPFGANGKTTGFAFVEYEQEAQANDAVRTINNFALDKRHTMLVNKYEDIERYQKTPAEFVAPKVEKFVEPKNLKTWLTDPARRDMFVLRHGSETEIFWSDKGEIELDYAGDREKTNGKQWCSQYVLWSPQGTYLATFHPQGIALWGGDKYEKVGRFAHKNVKLAVFSPNENYLITVSETDQESAIIIWDVKTSKMLRAFPAGKPGAKGEVVQGLMTPFKWSADDKYVARRGKDVISIYELPSMKLLEKKSLRAEGVHDFFWSPTDPILAYWAPEGNNVPARVSLVELPSRREVRQKNLFNVSDCKLHWHPNGTFLCVKVTRHSKSKKTMYTNFELFRVQEQLVPVEMLEVKDNIVAFAWEPKGTRFATVHGEGQQRLNVSFYDMDGGSKTAKEVTLLYTLKDKACSHLYWSPLGNNIVLAGLGEINGQLEFWDATEQQSITVQEHFKCTHVEWDPSGRVVATAVCQPLDNSYYKFTMDNGYTLWTFQGKQLLEEKKDAFYQFLWRPRPRTLLSDKEYNNVVKNLKKFEKRFDQMDRLKERERLAAENAERNRKEQEFQELLEKRLASAAARRAEYIALLDGYDSEDENEYIVQSHTYDDVLEVKEEVMRKIKKLCRTKQRVPAQSTHVLRAVKTRRVKFTEARDRHSLDRQHERFVDEYDGDEARFSRVRTVQRSWPKSWGFRRVETGVKSTAGRNAAPSARTSILAADNMQICPPHLHCSVEQRPFASRPLPTDLFFVCVPPLQKTFYQTLQQPLLPLHYMGVSRVVRTAVREEPASPTQAVEQPLAPAPLIILDWDDTILPNTHLAKLGFSSEDEDFEVPEDCVPTLEELAKEVENFLTACLKMGTCCIVTNGLDGWVERSCQRFLPKVVPLVEQMTIISARSNFEGMYPDRPIEWKIAVYRDLFAKRGFMQELPVETHGVYVQQQEREPQQVIALGDSQIDRCAIQYVARRTPNTQLKSIKLLDNPSMTQLQKQLNLLGVFLVQLSGHDEALDLELSNEMLQ